ncbi:hypothetical protein BC828DRAFT_383102 [Blastocladiella britannica]|nr:hypothetical protein BC828DRAFT_383102 [Blastocladiella britannica]
MAGAAVVLPSFPRMLPAAPMATGDIPAAETDDVFVGACAVMSSMQLVVPLEFVSPNGTYISPAEAVLGEVEPFDIEPVSVCTRYRITKQLDKRDRSKCADSMLPVLARPCLRSSLATRWQRLPAVGSLEQWNWVGAIGSHPYGLDLALRGRPMLSRSNLDGASENLNRSQR